MIILNVPVMSQRDPRWANQRLGTVDNTTIGNYGCIITCMAMLATYYGNPITPDKEDDWLTANQGYIQGNLYRNDAFGREFSNCSFDSIISCTNIPAPLTLIDNYLTAGKPVVVMVDFDHDPSDGIQTHFVLIVGKTDNNHYICNDPWNGDQIDFNSRYGFDAAQAINQINFFSGPVPQTPPSPQPNNPTPPDNNYSSKQAIIDIYQGLCGILPTEDEVVFRLNQLANGKNIVDVIKEICSGDGRFKSLWIEPNIPQPIPPLPPLPTPTPPAPDSGPILSQIQQIVQSDWHWLGVHGWKARLNQLRDLFK